MMNMKAVNNNIYSTLVMKIRREKNRKEMNKEARKEEKEIK